jgi:Raf kinase inhibitor-like YbhB/YbcL family protein
MFDIGSATTSIAQGQVPNGAQLGAEQQGAPKYAGPCPPSGTHTYSIRLYALDVASIGLATGATKAAVVSATTGHVLASAELTGTVAAADL